MKIIKNILEDKERISDDKFQTVIENDACQSIINTLESDLEETQDYQESLNIQINNNSTPKRGASLTIKSPLEPKCYLNHIKRPVSNYEKVLEK